MKRSTGRANNCMRRFPLLAGLTIILASPVAAEPVYLTCSGTIAQTDPVAALDEKIGPIAVTLNLSRKTISFGGHPAWPLTQNDSENLVHFEGSYVDTKGVRLYLLGDIDRITGQATVAQRRERGDGLLKAVMDLTCKPARPLF
jgi:hypothetical protein